MPETLSVSDLQILRKEADRAAWRLMRQLRLFHDELADLRQELLVDLFARLPAFDCSRGTLGAFAGLVMAHQATRIAGRIRRERKLFGIRPVSLDDPHAGPDGATRGDTIPEDQGLSAWFGQPVDLFAEVERRLDVERGLGSLDRRDGALCAALSHATVTELAAAGHGARSSLYDRIREIRLALVAAGTELVPDTSARG